MWRPSRQFSKFSGYTLLELIFVIGITGILTLVVMTFAINSARGYKYLEAQSNASVEVSSNLNRVSKVVRGTTDIVTADPDSLIIFGYFSPNDAIVKKIRYFKDGSRLAVGVTPPSGTAPNYTYNQGDETISYLVNDLSMGSSSLFTYYDEAGTQLTGAFAVTQIKQIGIRIDVNAKPNVLTKPVGSQTRVTLRNKKVNL